MQQQAVYDLLCARPHVPADVRHTETEFGLYRDGYTWALVMALRVMEAATTRYGLYVKTRRLEAKRRRATQRENSTAEA